MKNILTLRTLAVFSFVIFFLPFVQMCSDNDLKKLERQEVEVDQNGNEIISNPTSLNDKNSQESLSIRKENATQNFYFVSTLMLDEIDQLKNINITDFPVLGLTLILFSSVLILFLTFRNKFKTTSYLSISNLLILFCSTLILLLNEIIEDLNQIKIGYYLFVLNSILIIYFSNKLIQQRRLQKE